MKRLALVVLAFLPACSSCEDAEPAKKEPSGLAATPRPTTAPDDSSPARHLHRPFINRRFLDAGVRDASPALE